MSQAQPHNTALIVAGVFCHIHWTLALLHGLSRQSCIPVAARQLGTGLCLLVYTG